MFNFSNKLSIWLFQLQTITITEMGIVKTLYLFKWSIRNEVWLNSGKIYKSFFKTFNKTFIYHIQPLNSY